MRLPSVQSVVGILVAASACCTQAQDIQGPLRDPTRPPITGAIGRTGTDTDASSSGRIQMLLIGESRKYAVVDGVLLRQGDLHHQWRLSAINPESVVMRHASDTRVIKISPSVVKTPRFQADAANPRGGVQLIEKTPTRRSP